MQQGRTSRALSLVRDPLGALANGPTTLQAASSPLVRPDPAGVNLLTPDALRARTEGWQLRILELADMVPEVSGAASMVENSVNMIDLVVEGGDPARGGNTATRKAMQASLDSLNTGRLAKLMFLTGEGYIVWPDEEYPFTASVAELDTRNPAEPMLAGPNGERNRMPSSYQYMRVWREANGNRWQATSAHKACMDLVEAMYIYQIADTAIAHSRLATAGILVWPTTAKPQGINPDTGRPFPGSQEAVVEEFTNGARQNVSKKDPGASTIPFIHMVQIENGDTFHAPTLLRLDKQDLADEYRIRSEAQAHRYFMATELPIEALTGLGQTKVQGANTIREDVYRVLRGLFVDRIVQELVKRVAGQFGFTIRVDATRLLEKPENTEILMQLVQLEVIDIQYAFGKLGLDPSMAKEPPARNYSSNVVRTPPSDLRVGGNRGGGQFREK